MKRLQKNNPIELENALNIFSDVISVASATRKPKITVFVIALIFVLKCNFSVLITAELML